MGIFSFESFALAVLVVALAAFLAWRQMREAAEPLEERRDQREEGKNIIRFSDPSTIIIKDYQDALAKYNDTEHQAASMEPFCGEGKKIKSEEEACVIRCLWGIFDVNGNWYPNYALSLSPEEQYKQNVENGYIKKSNTGEQKRLTENEKREELARLNLPGIANTPEHLRPDPYSYKTNLEKAIKGIEKMSWNWPKS